MKVLTIDFNYIMYPCIKLYNHLCNYKENPTINWEFIENELEIEHFLTYDAEALKQIARIIRYNCNNKAKLIKIETVPEIVDKILSLENKIELTNIDWMHDIAYTVDDADNIQNFDTYNPNSWVGYLFNKSKLEKYIWIRARNSDRPNRELLDKLQFEFEEGSRSHLMSLPNDFDMIYFYFNSTQVPYKYKHLYDLISIIGEEIPREEEDV